MSVSCLLNLEFGVSRIERGENGEWSGNLGLGQRLANSDVKCNPLPLLVNKILLERRLSVCHCLGLLFHCSGVVRQRRQRQRLPPKA